jgi:hypothetical protein
MQDVASRVTTRIQLTTDDHRVYAEAVEGAFGADVDYAMLVKIYGASNDNPESRYSPATCIGCRTGVLAGKPEPRPYGCAVLHALQLLPNPQDVTRYACNGSGIDQSCVDAGRITTQGQWVIWGDRRERARSP